MSEIIDAAIARGEETTGLCTVREAVSLMVENEIDVCEMFYRDNGKKINVEIRITRSEDGDYK